MININILEKDNTIFFIESINHRTRELAKAIALQVFLFNAMTKSNLRKIRVGSYRSIVGGTKARLKPRGRK